MRSSSHVYPVMASQTKVACSFSSTGDYLAYSGFDGVLKIWETATGNSIADFSPSQHLTATCTCLQWGPGRHFQSPRTPQKKRRKKSDVEAVVGNLDLIAMGTTSGTVLLYSFSRGQIHTHLEKGHTDQVTAVCWHPSGTTLYSSSLDGQVVQWDVASSQVTQKWKASSGSVHSMCLCSSSHLLTADHAIKLWDLSTRTVVQKFTGHSTEVIRLVPVLPPDIGVDGFGDNEPSCSYFLSAAANDRIINVWRCHTGEKNAILSFSVTDEPAQVQLTVQKEQRITLAVLTTAGKVLVYMQTLNGKVKKPVKPQTVIHATTAGNKEEVSIPVSILAAVPRPTGDPTLLVAHGSAVKPKFETVALTPVQPEIALVVARPEKKAAKTEFSQVKTPEVSGSTVLYPSHMAPQGPGSRRKRKQSASELTVVERLEAMGVERPSQSSGTTKPPKADQLVVQLTQGLLSKDTKLLMNAFQERNEVTINNTVKRLPLHVIHPLVKELAQRVHGHPQSGLSVVRWIKPVLTTHLAYIMTNPDMVETLGELYQYIEYRTRTLPRRTAQQGRLQLLLSQIASQTQTEEETSASTEPLLVYQDESTDEELQMEFEASEEEDNWDEDDDSD